jgi:hypothetical protein
MKTSALWLGLAFAPLAMGGDEDRISEQEVIVADALVPTFYEIAPTYIETSMRAAVQRECTARAKGQPSAFDQKEMKVAAEWLCSGNPIHFVRGVMASGYEKDDGYVCKGEADAKYFPGDSFDYEEGFESECVSVRYDPEKKMHRL